MFLLGCAFLTLQVYFRLDDLTAARSDNMQFTISRLEVEHVKLQSAAENLNNADPTATDTFRRRFDAFYNRVNTLLASPLYTGALSNSGMAQDLRSIRTSLDEMTALVDQPDDVLRPARDALLAGIAPLSETIQSISWASLGIAAERSEAERAALARTLLQLAVISLLLIAALVALSFQLWTLFRRYRQRALENRTTLNRLSTILNTSLDHIVVIDPDSRIIEANAAADVAFALSGPDGQRKPITDVLLRRNDAGTTEPVSGARLIEACRNGPNRCAKVLARRADGLLFPVEMSAALAYQSGREVCVCYLRDISQRLAAQKEIEAARDRALAGEQAQARFLGMISHEMRTPLNGILGVVDLLDETVLNVEQRRYLRILQSAGQQLLTQINDALDLTQAGNGRVTLDRGVFDLDALLEEAISGLIAQAGARDTQIELRIPDGPLGLVEGDRARVLQVLVNLLSNAVKFTDGGQVTVEATRPEPAQPWVEVQVADTGRGIPDEDLPHIFNDFVRAGNIAGGDVPGSGLGLGIVRTLVQAMGGRVGVESIEGEGSLFWVRLPLDVASENSVRAPAPSPTGGDVPPLRVLVVEDNDANRFVATQMLLKDGHRVSEARSGEEALRLTQDARFDLILMDIRMPGLDGLETARRIRTRPGPAQAARLIFLTAHIQTENYQEINDLNIEAILAKPLRRTVLRNVLAGRIGGVPPANSHTVDARVMEQLRDTLPATTLEALLARFTEEGDRFVDGLQKEMGKPSEVDISRVHKFAGSAATFGASRLQERLGQLEDALYQGDTRRVRQELAGLPKLWRDTRARLTGARDAA